MEKLIWCCSLEKDSLALGKEDQGSSVHLEQDGFEMEMLVFAVPGESSEKLLSWWVWKKDPAGTLLGRDWLG